ncbi:MAG: hypothetical protein HUK21_07865 [Fibrobacteraceae bacterium]|nr:hypothetical protein [Fibrobacteraceae bacterium]
MVRRTRAENTTAVATHHRIEQRKNLPCYVALFLSLTFLVFSITFYSSQQESFSFIDSEQVLAKYEPLVLANEALRLKEQVIEQKMKVFEDSLARLMDTLSVRRGEEENLLNLLNLESNVQRHKLIDSTSIFAQDELKKAVENFNKLAIEYCKNNKLHLLFSTSNNTIIYGSGSKTDASESFITFMEGQNEK